MLARCAWATTWMANTTDKLAQLAPMLTMITACFTMMKMVLKPRETGVQMAKPQLLSPSMVVPTVILMMVFVTIVQARLEMMVIVSKHVVQMQVQMRRIQMHVIVILLTLIPHVGIGMLLMTSIMLVGV